MRLRGDGCEGQFGRLAQAMRSRVPRKGRLPFRQCGQFRKICEFQPAIFNGPVDDEARRLRAAVRIQTRTRALIARRHVDATRRHARATKIQSTSRMRSKRSRLRAMRRACLRLQSHRRMVCQRRQYRRDLAEKKEEAKLSNQLMKMQARDRCVITA